MPTALRIPKMDTYAIGNGSFSEIHPLENELRFDAFNLPPNSSWEPQCSKHPSALLPRSVEEGTIANVYGGNGFLVIDSIFGPFTSSPEHWKDPHPAIEDTAIPAAPESRLPTATSSKELGRLSRASAAENKNRKRKRHSTEGESEGNLERRRRTTHSRHGSGQSDQRCDGNSTLIKERNRIASNKFRNKRREDARRLESDEQDMERINSTLSACAANLTRVVYELKIKLLQHTDCDCTLIQNYLANEAQTYIRKLESTAQKGGTGRACLENR